MTTNEIVRRARAVDDQLLRIAEIRSKTGRRAAYEAARKVADSLCPPNRQRWLHRTALDILAAAEAAAAGDTCAWAGGVFFGRLCPYNLSTGRLIEGRKPLI